jgi:hypothetical protein
MIYSPEELVVHQGHAHATGCHSQGPQPPRPGCCAWRCHCCSLQPGQVLFEQHWGGQPARAKVLIRHDRVLVTHICGLHTHAIAHQLLWLWSARARDAADAAQEGTHSRLTRLGVCVCVGHRHSAAVLLPRVPSDTSECQLHMPHTRCAPDSDLHNDPKRVQQQDGPVQTQEGDRRQVAAARLLAVLSALGLCRQLRRRGGRTG